MASALHLTCSILGRLVSAPRTWEGCSPAKEQERRRFASEGRQSAACPLNLGQHLPQALLIGCQNGNCVHAAASKVQMFQACCFASLKQERVPPFFLQANQQTCCVGLCCVSPCPQFSGGLEVPIHTYMCVRVLV